MLDLGCGAGYGTALLYRAGARQALGWISTPPNVRYARRRFGGEGLTFRVADAEALPGDLGAFDLVVASNVLEHLRSPARVLERVADMLAPGGRQVAAVPPIVDQRGLAEHEAIPYHRSNLLVGQWRQLLARYFGELRAFRHLPPEGARLDFADLFPSRVRAEDFRFEEVPVEELSRTETLTALFVFPVG